jgi:hypothetical protein
VDKSKKKKKCQGGNKGKSAKKKIKETINKAKLVTKMTKEDAKMIKTGKKEKKMKDAPGGALA